MGKLFAICAFALAFAAHAAASDLMQDTWVATDGLGRRLPTSGEAGLPRTNRTVAVFYSIWHEDLCHDRRFSDGPFDLTKILAAHPDAMERGESPPLGPFLAPHHWGEPLFGYYLSDDPFVCRKHAQMLSDAGVDLVVFDVTNGHAHEKGFRALCDALLALRKSGARTPGFAFFCPLSAIPSVRMRAFGETVRRLYRTVYKPRLYEELWFRWKGKPLIMAHPSYCDVAGRGSAEATEMRGFFSFRAPVTGTHYKKSPPGGVWAWIDAFPQWLYTDADGNAEMTAVSVAQNSKADRSVGCMSSGEVRGRNWHDGANDKSPESLAFGLNFQEQWNHALKMDPPLLFVVGWNEWRAMRLHSWHGHGKPGGAFVDQFNAEFSRDCEPVRGEWGDAYLWQLTSYIRRYKGVRPVPAVVSRPIRIDAAFDDWRDVTPEFRDTVGDPVRRDWKGWGSRLRYADDSGRNDIEAAKVSLDGRNVCFYVRTHGVMTPPGGTEGDDWMRLFVDIDRDAATGWLGYDFMVEVDGNSPDRMAVRMHDGGGTGTFAWSAPVAFAAVGRAGSEMELAVPESAFKGRLRPDGFDFKWEDHAIQSKDWTDFTLHGDAAPNDRYNYRAVTPASQGPSTARGDAVADCARIFEAEIRDGVIHGAAVVAGGLDGTDVSASWGWADAAHTIPMTPRTVVDMASVTKTAAGVTAYLVAHARGKIADFDVPFINCLPAYTAPLARRVTLRDLANHVSGFGEADGSGKRVYFSSDPRKMLRNILSMPPKDPKSGHVFYSCRNYVLLGQTFETMTGCRAADFCRNEIFLPAGMNDTSLGAPLPSIGTDRLAQTFGTKKGGVISDYVARPLWAADISTFNAGLFSTAEDMAKLMRVYLREGVCDNGTRLFGADEMAQIAPSPTNRMEGARTFGWQYAAADLPEALRGTSLFHTGWSGQTVLFDLKRRRFAVVITVRSGDYKRAKRERFTAIGRLLTGECHTRFFLNSWGQSLRD